MEIIKISPNKILKKKNLLLIFLFQLGFLIVGWVLLLIYITNIKSTIDNNTKQKVFSEPSKNWLKISLPLTILSLAFSLFLISDYVQMFNIYPSIIFSMFIFLFFISFVAILLDIVFLKRKLNYCPKDTVFSTTVNFCRSLCPPGTYLGLNGECRQGCLNDSTCPEGVQCIENMCCNTDNNKIIKTSESSSICCPKSKVSSDGKHCCTIMCGSTCCADFDPEFAACSENNKCGLKCGDAVCTEDEACTIYHNVSSQGPEKDLYACVNKSETCIIKKDTWPVDKDGFELAWDKTEKCENQITNFLASTTSQSANELLVTCDKSQEKNMKGFVCGYENPIRFKKYTLSGCGEIDLLLEKLDNQSKEWNIVIDETETYLNVIENPNVNKDKPLLKSNNETLYTIITPKKTQNYKRCPSNKYYFSEDVNSCVCHSPLILDENGQCVCPGSKIWTFDDTTGTGDCIVIPSTNAANTCWTPEQPNEYQGDCEVFKSDCYDTKEKKDSELCPINLTDSQNMYICPWIPNDNGKYSSRVIDSAASR
jgi:hypothetical protein